MTSINVFAPRENVNDEVVTIVEFYAADGDFVARDARLLLLETSKSTFEVYAPEAGHVKYLVEVQADVPIEQPLCVLCETAELALAVVPVVNSTATKSPIDCGAGKTPETCHVISSPAPLLPASAETPLTGGNGKPARLLATEQLVITTSHPELLISAPTPSGQRASLEALSLLKKFGLQITDFPHLGMIRARDVLARIDQAKPESVPNVSEAPVPKTIDLAAPEVPRSRKKLSRSKRTEIARLVSASTSITSQVSVLVPSRGIATKLAGDAATAGQISSRLIFEVSRLLKHYPDLNGYYESDHVIHYDEVNVGYAMDIGQGLKVPIFFDADRASLEEIHRRKQELILKYLDGALMGIDLDRGTFTITDLSGYGAWTFNPLVNAHQAAILGVGAEIPLKDRQFVYSLILAFDHRLTEGLAATHFLNELSKRMIAHELVLERQLGCSPGTADSPGEPFCRDCRRTLSELKAIQARLLRTVVDEGQDRIVCTICADGCCTQI
jgi:pyruvate/2-oxoglutarate dehydrogenase complex dihydrolipoamide acyltransferase (E2) component